MGNHAYVILIHWPYCISLILLLGCALILNQNYVSQVKVIADLGEFHILIMISLSLAQSGSDFTKHLPEGKECDLEQSIHVRYQGDSKLKVFPSTWSYRPAARWYSQPLCKLQTHFPLGHKCLTLHPCIQCLLDEECARN